MTKNEYLSIKAAIERKHLETMAALETVYAFTNGENAPDSVVALRDAAISEDEARPDVSAGLDAERPRRRSKLSEAEKKEKKREYMKRYLAKKKLESK